jgi:hypothetical protein
MGEGVNRESTSRARFWRIGVAISSAIAINAVLVAITAHASVRLPSRPFPIPCACFWVMFDESANEPALPPMPPEAPARDEVVIDGTGDAVAANCAKDFDEMGTRLRYTRLRVVTTRSPKWGTVWRADFSMPVGGGVSPLLSRYVCSKEASLIRPLKMFDPAASIPPLDEAMRTTHPTTPR